ncbi:potassium channel family protein [Celeribacter baekdonensis]|mgnify:CR=1 FL=1|jgi:voltage-gated potassium channel|uniref:Ion transporter n=1 Tax=Celeribacter baekdonensis TaxID=875171 RepID=A0A2R4M0W2_9RHOB|nr:potassium channel family protein [Celeribacter baekdonensis]AVW90757.1 ion transporter [Celeribacter baekdonensis]|tara:strand:+ start:69532 stop:70305 length:774 start_codon:yes stop_codon:yes gene_type:complete
MASGFSTTLTELYEGETPRAHSFRYVLLGFDLVTICFVIVTSFFARALWIEVVDLIFGLLILMDFSARVFVSSRRLHYLTRPSTLADVAAMISFLAPFAGEGLGFLRILRTLRLLHTYQLMNRLRQDFKLFRKHEEVVVAAINLLVFIFVTTGLIYALEHGHNAQIRNYADALYFTITTLTTTGFGDITLQGTTGRLLSIGVMFFGVTLFLRLAQVLFRPSKVRYECTTCGLMLHDADAIHCKHCGAYVHIDTEGLN